MKPDVLPFVHIEPYMHDGDSAFGVWRSDIERYLLGDGDLWEPDSLRDTWPHARFLSWADVELGMSMHNNAVRGAAEPRTLNRRLVGREIDR